MTTHLFKNKSIYSTKTLCLKKEKHKYQLGIFILLYSLISFSVFGFQTDPSGTINKSYSVGEVSAKNNAGGLVGRNVNATIQISFSKSNVNRTEGSDENFGGFMGSNGDEENQLTGGNLLYCYSTGAVSYTNANNPNHKGFVGKQVGTPSHTANFFDSETSNQTSDLFSTASPASTAEMKQVSTFLAEGWKFKADENEWGINAEENEAYPFLRWEDFNAENIWLGSQSSNSNLATNWSEASVPTSTSAIRIPSETASNNTNLEVNSNLEIASLIIENEEGNLVVLPTKSIKVNGNITNNGQITFKSDATGDSYFDAFTGSISGTGDVVVEKYYPAKRAFRMVTSPVNSTTSIYDNWQNGGTNVSGIGTHITGSTTGADGLTKQKPVILRCLNLLQERDGNLLRTLMQPT